MEGFYRVCEPERASIRASPFPALQDHSNAPPQASGVCILLPGVQAVRAAARGVK